MTSKVGVHITSGPRNGYGPFIKKTAGLPLAVVMSLDDFGGAWEAKQENHAVVTIGRSEKKRQDPVNPSITIDPAGMDRWVEGGVSPEDAADRYYRAYNDIWHANPHIDIWITFNEWSSHWGWQSSFHIAMAEISKAKGDPWKWGFYGLSSGNPPHITEGDFTVVREMLPCLWYAKENGHHLCLHEYGDGEEGSFPFHTGRYQALYKFLKNPVLKDDTPYGRRADCDLFITESGFVEYPGEEMLIKRVKYLDKLYAGDGYLKGSALFTLGDWFQANIQDAVPEPLAEHIVTFTSPDQPPPPPIEEKSCRGAPRFQFKKKYHLIAGSPSPEQERAVFEVARLEKNSVGFSADDSMLGDLDSREAVVWGMKDDSALADEYRNFRDAYYPGVKLEFRTYPGDGDDDSDPDDDTPRSVSVVGGLHLRPGRQRDTDFDALKISNLSSVLILDQAVDDIPRLIEMGISPERIVMRLYFDPRGRDRYVSPSELFWWFMRPISMLRDRGGVYVQWLNEPNIKEESHGKNGVPILWDSPQECNRYMLDLLKLSRDAFGNDVQFGFPGFSPRPDTPAWTAGCAEAIHAYDWVAAHAYWCDVAEDTWQLDHVDHGGYWKRYLPYNEDIILTECGNLCNVPYETKAAQYLNYWRGLPRNVRQAFIWISSIDGQGNDFNERLHAWVTPAGVITPVPHIVGQRPD